MLYEKLKKNFVGIRSINLLHSMPTLNHLRYFGSHDKPFKCHR